VVAAPCRIAHCHHARYRAAGSRVRALGLGMVAESVTEPSPPVEHRIEGAQDENGPWTVLFVTHITVGTEFSDEILAGWQLQYRHLRYVRQPHDGDATVIAIL
jgi:hypothetical protein